MDNMLQLISELENVIVAQNDVIKDLLRQVGQLNKMIKEGS